MCHSTYQASPAVSRSPGWRTAPTTNVRAPALAAWWCGASNMVVSGQSFLILKEPITRLATV